MPEPVWLSHPDGRIAFVNRVGLELLHLPPAEIMENGWMELVHPQDRDYVVSRVMHTLKTGEPFDTESRLRDSHGIYKWIRSRARALRDSSGAIIAFVGHIIDVDQYKTAEIQARNAEARMRRLIDAPLFGYVRLDQKRNVLDCNEAFAHMLGYTREELLHATLWDLTPPEWHAASQIALTEVFTTGATGPFRKEYVRKDGTRIAVLVVGALDPAEPEYINSYIVDLSAESHYKQAFERARDINETLLDAIPMVFWTTDAEGEVNYWNRWFYEYTGLSPEEALSEEYWKIIHPDDVRMHQSRWQNDHRIATASDHYIRYRRASDSSFRWHLVHAEPIEDNQGNLQGWLGFSLDVHDQRRAAERQSFLLRATERIGSLLEADEIFQQVARECVPEMADSAVAFAMRDGALQPVAICAVSPEREATLRTLHATFGAGPPASPILTSLRERRSILLTKFGPDAIDSLDISEYERAILKSLNTTSLIATPLFDEEGDIGVLLTNNGPSGRVHDELDMQTLRVLGDRLVVSIENARRYAREHRVAEALQTASLPQSLPAPRGIQLSAHYAAAPSEADIGGDWYDAVELQDGRVVLSIGDVTGRGLEAAVTMANIRQIIRGIAHVHPDPALMLEAADRALRAEHPDTYVTTFTCVIDPIESVLIYASAGHPPALLRKRSGGINPLGTAGLPLGIRMKGEPSTVIVPVEEGDALILYTDGVTEVRRDAVTGEQDLMALIERGDVLGNADPARAIYDELVGNDARDDIAILVAQIGELDARTSTRMLRRWSANARDEQRIRAIRSDVLGEILFCHLDDETIFRAEMILGELIGNVVRHTPGAIEVVLERRRGAIVLHVLDNGEGFQFSPRLPLDAFSERGRGLYIAAQLSDDFSVTRRPQGGSHARSVVTHR